MESLLAAALDFEGNYGTLARHNYVTNVIKHLLETDVPVLADEEMEMAYRAAIQLAVLGEVLEVGERLLILTEAFSTDLNPEADFTSIIDYRGGPQSPALRIASHLSKSLLRDVCKYDADLLGISEDEKQMFQVVMDQNVDRLLEFYYVLIGFIKDKVPLWNKYKHPSYQLPIALFADRDMSGKEFAYFLSSGRDWGKCRAILLEPVELIWYHQLHLITTMVTKEILWTNVSYYATGEHLPPTVFLDGPPEDINLERYMNVFNRIVRNANIRIPLQDTSRIELTHNSLEDREGMVRRNALFNKIVLFSHPEQRFHGMKAEDQELDLCRSPDGLGFGTI